MDVSSLIIGGHGVEVSRGSGSNVMVLHSTLPPLFGAILTTVGMSVGRICARIDLDVYSPPYLGYCGKDPRHVHNYDFIYTRILLNSLFSRIRMLCIMTVLPFLHSRTLHESSSAQVFFQAHAPMPQATTPSLHGSLKITAPLFIAKSYTQSLKIQLYGISSIDRNKYQPGSFPN